MSSLIIKDIKYHVLKSLTLIILELLPQTLYSFYAKMFSIIFPNFWSHFVELRPHMVTLINFDGTFF